MPREITFFKCLLQNKFGFTKFGKFGKILYDISKTKFQEKFATFFVDQFKKLLLKRRPNLKSIYTFSWKSRDLHGPGRAGRAERVTCLGAS
jgi:hypothetical protein